MVYKWYILPIGGLYASSHLLGNQKQPLIIGNTSSFRVHFPASYVRLLKCTSTDASRSHVQLWLRLWWVFLRVGKRFSWTGAPGVVGQGDEILPSHVGIIVNHYKDLMKQPVFHGK